ncbi:MAG: helicase-exonuclease AddAB subunit AddA [Lachnospiraceae bacterium]|nr:helicase-exonuclease AddAB subunit AddA [Lachnospiraceae bacterium]
MGISFTAEQQKVIDTHGCNILVSAAAGSGKTAVLVERIVKMISDAEKPVDIDRLLIVTFTNAAAAEMRERISTAIGNKLLSEPENEHLQRQATLLHNAQITTIDSFCLFVIRNHFHTIGLDPGFRIADEGEMKLLKADVMGDVLEKCYLDGEESFLHCMEYFSTGSSDKAVEEAVFKLYDFAMSYPFPEEWLMERKNDYALVKAEDGAKACDAEIISCGTMQEQASELNDLDWMQELMEDTTLQLQGALDRISQCAAICNDPNGPYMYAELLEQEQEQIEKLIAAKTYEERYLLFDALVFGRLSSKKDATVSTNKRELVKNTRAGIKDQLQSMQKTYFAQPWEEVVRQMEACGEAVSALVDLTLRFKEEFDSSKRTKNLIDFDDMEHFALSILLNKKEDGSVEPTETALEYRSYFEEILIDEYQDSNLVQEYLLSAISGEDEGKFNRFMVGDVKQSIYKFRLARPELFMEKYDSYVMEEDDKIKNAIRIDLHKNFRSRKEVLTSTNAVFSQVMTKKPGGIEYDENAALYLGADYPSGTDNKTELILFIQKEDELEPSDTENKVAKTSGEMNSKQQEAYGIAGKIKELVTTFRVTDSETGKLRKASYKDIVILLRTTTGWDEEFKQVLEGEGIPVHVTSKTGYFAAAEIQQLLHFLRVLDNPLQDIPFYGVMNSCFGGFTQEEIAAVKAAFPNKRYLYDAVNEYTKADFESGEACEHANACETAEVREIAEVCDTVGVRDTAEVCEMAKVHETGLVEKLKVFMENIEKYREMAVYMPVHELLQTIIREYSYLNYVAAKPGGSRRRANVEMLLVKAADYEKTSYYGLYHFLRYIEQLEKYDVDYGEANLQDENADVVRIMSIHKSKGLEFPICIVAGLSKSFNNRDTNDSLVMDVDMGIGADYINPERRIKSRNLRRNVIAAKLKIDNLAEELRILYVAMTRAKEKLILTGLLKNHEKKVLSLLILQGYAGHKFSYDMLMQMGSFLDVLLYAAARNKCFDEIWKLYGMEPDIRNPLYGEEMDMKVSMQDWEATIGIKIKESIKQEDNRRRLVLYDASNEIDKTLMTVMSEKFSYQYPYENLKDLYTKTTVSELKKAGMYEETDFSFPLYEEETIVPYLPKFIKDDVSVSGTDRGSSYHKVMELLDFSILTDAVSISLEEAMQPDISKMLEEAVQADMNRMLTQGKMSQAYYDVVAPSKIAIFLKSNIAKRMAKAAALGKLYREQPFVLGLPANRLNKAFPQEETVLIQGIIDVFFEEDGKFVVVDYKTDAVKKPEELIERYKTQLDYYAEALLQILGERMTKSGDRSVEEVIYSFGLGMEIEVVK